MKKLQTIIEQIEFSRTLIKSGTETSLRMALVILDNTAEILMYRKIQQEFSHSDFYKRLLSQYKDLPDNKAVEKHKKDLLKNIIPDDEVKKISKYFAEKANFLSLEGLITPETNKALTAIHEYRNEIFHRDKSRKGSICPVSILLFEITCGLVTKLDLHTRSANSEDIEELGKFYSRYGFKGRTLLSQDDLESIIIQLKASVNITLEELSLGLKEHLEKRLSDIGESIKFIEENTREGTLDQVLPNCKKTSEKFRKDLDKIAFGTNKTEVFNIFVEIENMIEPFEKDVEIKANDLDSFLQMQLDILRGK